MSSVFGIPCIRPPSLGDVYFSTALFPLSMFAKSIFKNPNQSMNKYERFFYSKLFMTIYLWYVVFRIPRELSLFLNRNIGLNFGILLVIHMIFVLELFKAYGYECTVFLVIIMYLLYSGLMYLLSLAADSALGDALPELKELPVAKRTPGLNHCRRLAICRVTPVFDNYVFQRGKYEKCVECAKKNERIIFKSSKSECGSKKRDINAKECYECTENTRPEFKNCTYSTEECENVNMVLDILDPPIHSQKFEDVYDSKGEKTLETRIVTTTSRATFDRAKVCKESHASLCWFGKLPGNKYRGWNYLTGELISSESYETFDDLNDPRSIGQGFPTREVCLSEMSKMQDATIGGLADDICVMGVCDVSDKKAECACTQYRDVAQFKDPCKFLEANCDEKSIAYTEAQLKVKQADIDVSNIVRVDDARRLLNDLDNLSNAIP